MVWLILCKIFLLTLSVLDIDLAHCKTFYHFRCVKIFLGWIWYDFDWVHTIPDSFRSEMLRSKSFRIDPLFTLHRLAISLSNFYFAATPYTSFTRSTTGYPSCFACNYKQKQDFRAKLSSKSAHITPKYSWVIFMPPPELSDFHATSRAEWFSCR